MKKEIEINEWIESYLNGDLSSGEMDYFLKFIQENPSLAREVEKHKELRELIVDGAYLNLKNELKTIHLKKIQLSKNIRRITGFGLGGLIVGLVLLLVFKNESETNKTVRENVITEIKRKPVDVELNPTKNENFASEKKENKTLPNNNNKDASNLSDIQVKDVNINQPNQDNKKIAYKDSITHENKTTTVPANDLSEAPDNHNPIPHSKNKTVSEPVNSMKINCRKIKFELIITVQESCNNSPTGSFTINRQSITGGQPPYAFSINRASFFDTLFFASLYPGNYPVYVKDGNNCIGMAGIAQIGSIDCSYQAVFAPLKGETWNVPVSQSGQGFLQIFSKSGVLVYSRKVNGGETTEWNGETTTGQQLPMGIYQFEIKYTDGSRFIGNVTIIK